MSNMVKITKKCLISFVWINRFDPKKGVMTKIFENLFVSVKLS